MYSCFVQRSLTQVRQKSKLGQGLFVLTYDAKGVFVRLYSMQRVFNSLQCNPSNAFPGHQISPWRDDKPPVSNEDAQGHPLHQQSTPKAPGVNLWQTQSENVLFCHSVSKVVWGPLHAALLVTGRGLSQWSWLNPNYGDNSFTRLPVRTQPCCAAQAKRPAWQRLRGKGGLAQLRQAQAPAITCSTCRPLTGAIYKKVLWESINSICRPVARWLQRTQGKVLVLVGGWGRWYLGNFRVLTERILWLISWCSRRWKLGISGYWRWFWGGFQGVWGVEAKTKVWVISGSWGRRGFGD